MHSRPPIRARVLGARLPTDRPFISVRPPLREYTLTTARRARTAVALFVDGFSLSDAMSSKFARAHALYSVGLLAPERALPMEMRYAIPMSGPVPRA